MEAGSSMNFAQHEHEHGGMNMMMMMPMYFWTGNDVTYLFKNISSDSAGTLMAGMIGVFILAVLIEFVSYLRKYIHFKAQLQGINSAVRLAQNAPVLDVQINIIYRLILSFVYMAMVTLGFFLMLLVMTFNVGVIIAAIAGLFAGNVLFGMIPLPKLPLQYKFVEGKGFYCPESDKCCKAVEDSRMSYVKTSRPL